jgi:hypothetical protein
MVVTDAFHMISAAKASYSLRKRSVHELTGTIFGTKLT